MVKRGTSLEEVSEFNQYSWGKQNAVPLQCPRTTPAMSPLPLQCPRTTPEHCTRTTPTHCTHYPRNVPALPPGSVGTLYPHQPQARG